MSKAVVRAGIYVRISRDDEGKEGAGLGVQRQQKDCEELAARLGWTVVRVFSDNDITAMGSKRRPAYEELLEAIRSGEVGGIIVWHLDRLHRSLTELERYGKLVTEREVPTVSAKSGELDMSTATGRMVAVILGAVSRHEVEHGTERMKAQKEQMRKAGLKNPGPRPYGYQWAGKAKEGKLVIDPEEAARIRDACKAVLAGRTLYAIAREMNAAGARTPRGSRWHQHSVGPMLCRASNAGLIEHKGRLSPGQWEPILSEEDWRAVRAVLTDPARRMTPGPKPVHLLTGVLTCGVCGSVFFSAGPRKGRQVYRCRPRGCTSADEAALNTLVVAAITGLLAKPESAAALHPAIDVAGLTAEKEALKARLRALAADTRLSDEQVAIRSESPLSRVKSIEAELARSTANAPVTSLAGREDAEERWFSLPIEQQREVAQALVKVTLLPARRRGRLPKGAPRLDTECVRVEWTELVTDAV